MLTLFRMGAGKKTFHNRPFLTFQELAPKFFSLLVSTLILHWYNISSSYLVPVPNYLTLTKTTPQKSNIFANIIKTLTMCIITIFRDSIKV